MLSPCSFARRLFAATAKPAKNPTWAAARGQHTKRLLCAEARRVKKKAAAPSRGSWSTAAQRIDMTHENMLLSRLGSTIACHHEAAAQLLLLFFLEGRGSMEKAEPYALCIECAELVRRSGCRGEGDPIDTG